MLNAHNNSPVFGRHAFNYAIQHYNARCHMVRVCTELLGQHHICMLPWTVLPHIYDKFYYLFNESGKRACPSSSEITTNSGKRVVTFHKTLLSICVIDVKQQLSLKVAILVRHCAFIAIVYKLYSFLLCHFTYIKEMLISLQVMYGHIGIFCVHYKTITIIY